MNMYVIQNDDAEKIREAIRAGGDIWENPILAPVKRKIKNYYRGVLNENCCYCRRDTTDEFNMVLDIEHVLPKAIYGVYMFTPYNLSVSCKRCNMEIKKDKIFFLNNSTITDDLAKNRQNYKIIHPNFDTYNDHLAKMMVQVGDQKIIKYMVVNDSEKGGYTKEFFELQKFEQDSFDAAQGIATTDNVEGVMPEDIENEFKDLLKRHFS